MTQSLPVAHHQGRRRRAFLSIAMLVGLIVIGLIAASVLRVAAARRLALRVEERTLQVEVLVGSGIERAMVRLAASPEYGGETWELTAAELRGRGPARVRIDVHPDPASAPGRLVIVAVDLFASSQNPVRLTRTLRVSIDPSAR